MRHFWKLSMFIIMLTGVCNGKYSAAQFVSYLNKVSKENLLPIAPLACSSTVSLQQQLQLQNHLYKGETLNIPEEK